MKTLVPLVVGILLAVGVVKLSKPADPAYPVHPTQPVQGAPQEPALVSGLPSPGALQEAWSMPEDGARREPGPLAALATGAPAAELRAGRKRLEARHPEEAQRRALFDRLRAVQTRSEGVSLETLDALLSGTGLEEEDLSDGVLMPMDECMCSDERHATQRFGVSPGLRSLSSGVACGSR